MSAVTVVFAGRIASELMLSQVIFILEFQSAVIPPIANTLLSGPASIGRQQADHHHRIGEDVGGGVERLVLGSGDVMLHGGRLQDRFQIDRQRMIAGGDHVLLMHVACREAVKQRKPGAGAPEKALAARLVGARRDR